MSLFWQLALITLGLGISCVVGYATVVKLYYWGGRSGPVNKKDSNDD